MIITSSSILLLLQKDIVFYDNYQAISGDAPNWRAYLIKQPYLLWLRDHSTHWRATCQYNTIQMAPYTQITWEPRLRTLTSLEMYPWKETPVDLTNMSTSGEMSVWIALHTQGIKKVVILCMSTLILTLDPAISTQARRPYLARTTLESTILQITNSVVPQTRVIRLSSGSEANSTLTKQHSFVDPMMICQLVFEN